MKSDGVGLRLGPQAHQIKHALSAADALYGWRQQKQHRIQSHAIGYKSLETVALGGRGHLRVLGVDSFQLRTHLVAVAIRP
jgi:hypothetical protein